MAQGGHLAGLVASHVGHEVAVTFRAPCPLDVPLTLVANGAGHTLLHEETVVLEAAADHSTPSPPPFVPWEVAEEARDWAEAQPSIDRVGTCFSCGSGTGSLRVHAGSVAGSSLYASPLRPPEWAAPDGRVAQRFLWAPIDCAAGWRVTLGEGGRLAVTGRLRVQVHDDVSPGDRLVVVADAAPEWTGRKRGARSAIYRDDGTLVASSESLWIAVG